MLLGREVEQADLTRVLTRVRSGEGGSLIVKGDPGIGKSTLLDWTATVAAGLVVLRASGREAEADLPFVGLGDLLRPLQEGIGRLPRPQARALGSALSLTGPAVADRLAVNAAVLNLLERAGRRRPLLVLVDDYHWLDSATREVVDFLVRRTEPLAIGLVLTTRDRTPPDYRGEVMRLEAIGPAAAEALVRGRGSVRPEVVRRIVHLAAGNPLALVELPLSLEVQPRDRGLPLEGPLPVSVAIERAFRDRIDVLSEAARQAVLCAAEESSGSYDSIRRALEVLGFPGEAITEAVAANLITVVESAVQFRHPLVRSVVHQTADAADIRRVHRALADAVPDEDSRAWHQAAAASGTDEAAAAGLEESAHRALARGAAEAATAALVRAAELTASAAERARRTGAAARAAHLAGDMAATSDLIDRARRLMGGVRDPGLLLLEADIRMRHGDFAGAYGTLQLEARRLARHDAHRAATMLLVGAKFRVYRLEAAAAMREVDEALALLEEGERDVVHLAAVGMTRTMAGAPGAAAAAIEAMEAALESPHGHTHTLAIGWPLLWLEEYERARAFITRSVAIQREGGHLAYLPQALLPLAELDFRTGRWGQARAQANEALRLFEEGEQPTEAAFASALLARLEAACGDDRAAQAHAADAEESDLRSALAAATAHAHAARGLLALGRGDYAVAADHLQRARSLVDRGGIGEPGLLPLHADLSEVLARAGDRAGASSVAADLVRQGEVHARRSAIAAGLRCQALVAAEDSYRDLFVQAIALHQQLPTPFELARTELCFGERLRRSRHRVESRSHLRHALGIFEVLGAGPWIERARTELSATGESVGRPSLAILTPQERQVATIVAAGATNREAAAVLFVNAKTIEFHLGNVYRKLGLRSRTELANALPRFQA